MPGHSSGQSTGPTPVASAGRRDGVDVANGVEALEDGDLVRPVRVLLQEGDVPARLARVLRVRVAPLQRRGEREELARARAHSRTKELGIATSASSENQPGAVRSASRNARIVARSPSRSRRREMQGASTAATSARRPPRVETPGMRSPGDAPFRVVVVVSVS